MQKKELLVLGILLAFSIFLIRAYAQTVVVVLDADPNAQNFTGNWTTFSELGFPANTSGGGATGGAFTTENYTNTSAIDNHNATVTGTSGNDEGYIFLINLTNVTTRATMNWAEVNCMQSDKGAKDANNMSVYNWSSGSYVRVAGSATSTPFTNVSFNISGVNISTFFMNSDNLINVACYGTGGSADTVNLDWVQMNYSYNDLEPFWKTNIATNNSAPAIYDAVNITSQWSDDHQLSMYTLETNMTGTTACSVGFVNESAHAFLTNNWTNETRTINETCENQRVVFKVYANDSVNGFNNTTYATMNVANHAPRINPTPAWTIANNSPYVIGTVYNFSDNATDFSANPTMTFVTNLSGSWATYTGVTTPAIACDGMYNKNCSIKFTLDQTKGAGTYFFYWNSSDGSLNNNTGNTTYTIAQSPTNKIVLLINGTRSNKTLVYPNATKAETSFVFQSGGGTGLLWLNGTNIATPNETLFSGGFYIFKANTSGNTNWTANDSGENWNVSIMPQNISIALYLNGTQGNVSYGHNDIANFTAQANVTNAINISLVSNYTGWVMVVNNTTIRNTTEALNHDGEWWNLTANFSGNANYSANSTTYFFNVSNLIHPPQYANEFVNISNNSPFNTSNVYKFNISWTDPSDNVKTVLFQSNFTGTEVNYTHSSTPAITNDSKGNFSIVWTQAQTLGAGNYTYKWYADDDAGSWNNTTDIIYGISKQPTGIFLYLNNTAFTTTRSITYPNASNTNATINVTSLQASVVFRRNNTIVANPEEILLGAGVYNYSGAYAGSNNYSASSTEKILNVLQNTSTASSMNLTINGTEANVTVVYPAYTTVRGNNSISQLTFTLYNNTSAIGTANPQWDNQTFGGGMIMYVYNTSGNENYSAASKEVNLTIAPQNTSIILTLNGTNGDRVYNQYDLANFTARINITGLSVSLNSNYTGWAEQTDVTTIYNTTNLTTAGSENFNMTANFSGNENYTKSNATHYFNVTAMPPPVWGNVTSTPIPPIVYGAYPILQFYSDWYAPANMSLAMLENNFTGTWYNNSTNKGAGNLWFLATFEPGAGNYSYRWFGNDSFNQFNNTTYYNFEITQAPNPINLTLNGTENNFTYTQGDTANFQAYDNTNNGTISLISNYTGWVTQSNSSGYINNDTYLASSGDWFNMTANATGDQNYSANSTTLYFNVTALPNSLPKWTNETAVPASPTDYMVNKKYNFSINWTDNDITPLSMVFFENNFTGTWFNNSTSTCGGDYFCSNWTDLPAGVFLYRWLANDTADAWNNTTNISYSITKGATLINLYLNGSQSNRSYNVVDIANFTAKINITGLNISLYSNYPAFGTINNTTTIRNTTNLTTVGDLWNLTSYYLGNFNYSVSNVSYFFNVSATIPPPTNVTGETGQRFCSYSKDKKTMICINNPFPVEVCSLMGNTWICIKNETISRVINNG